MRFDPDDPVFAAHFPGNPVTPGSLVVQGFVEAARQSGFCRSLKGIENFRFRRFVAPGSYCFEIRRRSDRVHCKLFGPESTLLVSGALII